MRSTELFLRLMAIPSNLLLALIGLATFAPYGNTIILSFAVLALAYNTTVTIIKVRTLGKLLKKFEINIKNSNVTDLKPRGDK